MKILRFILVSIFIFGLLSCEKEDDSGNQKGLIGCWIKQKSENSIVTYKRAGKLKEKEYGLEFKEDNKYIERRIDGWCATPPVNYKNYKGVWRQKGSILYISVNNWDNNVIDRKMEIISVNKNELKLKIIE